MVSVGLIWQFVEMVLLRMSKVTKMSTKWSSNKKTDDEDAYWGFVSVVVVKFRFLNNLYEQN